MEQMSGVMKFVGSMLTVVTLTAALFGAGYNYRQLADLVPRVERLETQGSPAMKEKLVVLMTEVEYIKKAIEENKVDHKYIIEKLDNVAKEIGKVAKVR